jgi:ATP-dependent Lon protease
MSASRWNTGPLSGPDDSSESENPFQEAFLPSILTRVEKKDEPQQEGAPGLAAEDETVKYPEVLPILPLRGVVVYPQTAVPLTIGQPRSIRMVDDVAVTPDKLIGLVAARDPEMEEPGPKDLYRVGTIAVVHRLFRAPDNTIRLLVQGLMRMRLVDFTETEPYLKARVEVAPELVESGLEVEALARSARDQFEQISVLSPSIPRELVTSISALEDPLQTVYTIANFQRIELQDAQTLLDLDSTKAKLEKMVELLAREAEVLSLGAKIQNEARSEIEKVQREYFLREQMKAIQKELGEQDEQAVEVEELRKKIEKSGMPEEAGKQARRELDRMARLPTAAAEYGVIRTYLDWLVSLPWSQATADNLDVAHARQVLDQDHYGLKDIKERILEFLAIRKLRLERKEERVEPAKDVIRREREGVILCFIGPPGVGKTSLGQSIARAMERKFVRISLGGVRDEAEIRGHRRTYIGAMPGRILQALRRVESRNPVFMLDEVDKLTMDFHGDPASALLEVLDPEQNVEFRDNYLEVAYDLSQVFFITTANQLETIPAPLLDRMEIIQLSGYTEIEKIAIARGYLLPRQIRENGLRTEELVLSKEGLKTIIREYTREAGVRNLERRIGAICRKVGTRLAEGKPLPGRVTPRVVKELLGHPVFLETEEIDARTSIPGVVPGLAWTPFGGDILFIEATRMPGSKGFQVTGSVGNVMQESARAALSYVRSHAEEIGLKKDFYDQADLHLHVPTGAQPKDGPSAGVTMATALVSLISGRPVKKGTGMTGEITLRGQVLPVGGIKEKLLAAHRAGLRTVILPKRNSLDVQDAPAEVRRGLVFVFAETVNEVLKAALERPSRPVTTSRKQAEKNHVKSAAGR